MPQQEIEIILARQLASYLAVPVFIVDPEGNLLFFNEPAEVLLGRRFEETGSMPEAEWSTIFEPADDDGRCIPPAELPLVITVAERRPAHRRFWIRSLDGKSHHLELTSLPIIGLAGRYLGAIAIFWEAGS